MIGRLKRSLNKRCPECGNILQIRVRDIKELRNGIQVTVSEEYIACSNKNCEYEREIEQKRIRRKEDELAF
jgi:DNA-directed RNA polymerase subunit M/transcription elongation factor TFIIS